MNAETIGHALRNVREGRAIRSGKIGRPSLSALTGPKIPGARVSQSYIQKIENGQINVTVFTLSRILAALEVTMTEFFAYVEGVTPPVAMPHPAPPPAVDVPGLLSEAARFLSLPAQIRDHLLNPPVASEPGEARGNESRPATPEAASNTPARHQHRPIRPARADATAAHHGGKRRGA